MAEFTASIADLVRGMTPEEFQKFPRPFRHCVSKRQTYEQVQAVDEPAMFDRVPP